VTPVPEPIATNLVHWPGKDIYACDRHLMRLARVALAIGVQLSVTPCEPTVCANCENEAVEAAQKGK